MTGDTDAAMSMTVCGSIAEGPTPVGRQIRGKSQDRHRQTDRRKNGQTCRQSYRQACRLTDRMAATETDRQTHRQRQNQIRKQTEPDRDRETQWSWPILATDGISPTTSSDNCLHQFERDGTRQKKQKVREAMLERIRQRETARQMARESEQNIYIELGKRSKAVAEAVRGNNMLTDRRTDR